MVTIYGSPKSSAGRCYWALEEAGIAYERADVSLSDKEHKAADYLALNPNGKVPVFVDEDLVLWESVAINRYIFDKHLPELVGNGLGERALTHQWSVWSQIQYQVPLVALFIQLVFVPEERRDAKVMADARAKIGPLNTLLDTHLAKTGQMVGDHFTIADLDVASVARINGMLGIDLSQCAHLNDWLERTLARPACQRVDAME